MSDEMAVGNDPGNGVVKVLGDSGDVRATLFAWQTEFAIALPAAAGLVGAGGRNRGGVGPPAGDASAKNVGALDLYTEATQTSVKLRGDGSAVFGGGGANGSIAVLGADGRAHLSGQNAGSEQFLVLVGGGGLGGMVVLRNANDVTSITLDGVNGDISLANADCAEEFDVDEDVFPGAVVVVNESGRLSLAQEEYDPRVVGIVSGLGDYRPGLVLDRQARAGRLPVAMFGKVTCLVDTGRTRVRCGDLLTTSDKPGYAMVAHDRLKATGSVVGKALTNASEDEDRVSVLVMAR